MADVLPERREFKYLVPTRRIDAIRKAASGACDPDCFAGPDGTYRIRSLYLDTDDLRLFKANEREAPDRFKARIRSYPASPMAPVFFEVKRRTLDIIRKARAPVPTHTWRNYLHLTGSRLEDPTLNAQLERFQTLQWMHDLRPKVLVEYRREAYASRIEDYARVTIDSQICCQRANGYDLSAQPNQWRFVDHRWQTLTAEPVCVVELKFANAPPRWMVELVRSLELTRYAFSKYCFSMTAQAHQPIAHGVQAGWR